MYLDDHYIIPLDWNQRKQRIIIPSHKVEEINCMLLRLGVVFINRVDEDLHVVDEDIHGVVAVRLTHMKDD